MEKKREEKEKKKIAMLYQKSPQKMEANEEKNYVDHETYLSTLD